MYSKYKNTRRTTHFIGGDPEYIKSSCTPMYDLNINIENNLMVYNIHSITKQHISRALMSPISPTVNHSAPKNVVRIEDVDADDAHSSRIEDNDDDDAHSSPGSSSSPVQPLVLNVTLCDDSTYAHYKLDTLTQQSKDLQTHCNRQIQSLRQEIDFYKSLIVDDPSHEIIGELKSEDSYSGDFFLADRNDDDEKSTNSIEENDYQSDNIIFSEDDEISSTEFDDYFTLSTRRSSLNGEWHPDAVINGKVSWIKSNGWRIKWRPELRSMVLQDRKGYPLCLHKGEFKPSNLINWINYNTKKALENVRCKIFGKK